MRISELLENAPFKDTDFVKHVGEKKEIDFDLAEDLMHFMQNDDDCYRRHLYPSIMHCSDRIDLKQKTRPGLFAEAVKECYKTYLKKFPIRELPSELSEQQVDETCKKMHEEICQQIKDGKYKE